MIFWERFCTRFRCTRLYCTAISPPSDSRYQCELKLLEIKKCNFSLVHGHWSSWSSFGSCSKSCGGGAQYRRRTCSNPAPSGGGKGCPGSSYHSRACNTKGCPGKTVHATYYNDTAVLSLEPVTSTEHPLEVLLVSKAVKVHRL